METVKFGQIKEQSYTMKESLRALKTNIQFCGDDVKTILITSAVPNEGKSTVAILSIEGEIIEEPFEIVHNIEGLKLLEEKMKEIPKENLKIVMEETGTYHLPVLGYLLDKNYFAALAKIAVRASARAATPMLDFGETGNILVINTKLRPVEEFNEEDRKALEEAGIEIDTDFSDGSLNISVKYIQKQYKEQLGR